MKSDLDAIMQANNVDVLLITGAAQHNPAMVYMTGGAHLTGADLIKKRGEPAVVFCGAMERDEAAKTGLQTRSYNAYPYRELLKEAGGDMPKAVAIRYQRMLKDLGISTGNVVLYGNVELSVFYPILVELTHAMPGLTFVGDMEGKVIGTAMLTKDEAEIERIRHMGKITTEVVGMVADYLTSQQVRDEELYDADGRPVTIGRVKGLINLWLAERGAENPEGTIFAQGRDAGVPHSSGNPDDVMRLGAPIVFDIYPCEAGGGYFYDFTRTWCLGYAPDAVQGIYDQVKTVYNTVVGDLKRDALFRDYQKLTCDMFEEMGHATIQKDPATEEGYIHSLGHGVGLKIHERPFSGASALDEDKLVPGAVITIEPGLYYPSRNLGVRLEDTLAVHEDGTMEILAPYPMDLVLPMKRK